ncbi:hypothetical protein [Floridanema fluviatile]
MMEIIHDRSKVNQTFLDFHFSRVSHFLAILRQEAGFLGKK